MLVYWLVKGSSAAFPIAAIGEALFSSLSLALGGAALCLVLAVPVGLLVVRYKGQLAIWAERLPYLLHALPGLVIALALVYFSLHYVPALYQTSALLLVAYALLFLPLAQAPIRTALNKAAPQLEEAARTLGACSKKKAEAPPPQVPEGQVFKVTPAPLTLTTELPGRTSAFQVAEVRPQVSGVIQKRLFTEGADVKAGTPLYQIDPATYQANVNSAKATLAKARATLLSSGPTAKRYKELLDIEGISRQDYETALATDALQEELRQIAAGNRQQGQQDQAHDGLHPGLQFGNQ